MDNTRDILNAAKESIQRIQKFDTESLPRKEQLGVDMNFEDAVLPAKKIINLYKKINLDILHEYPDKYLQDLQSSANADYGLFDKVLKFSLKESSSPDSDRTGIISHIENRYNSLFPKLESYITYSACRTTDFTSVEERARGVFQGITDSSDKLNEEMNRVKDEADRILEEVRQVAAEQGVSQQAKYFKDESEMHAKKALTWSIATFSVAVLLVLISIGMMFLTQWDWLTPDDKYSAVQLISGKVFIFATISYILFLCGRSYQSHKHNEIVSRHRQNSLLTYNHIVDASGTPEGKELILAQASNCMFSPQETGYIRVVPGDSNFHQAVVDSASRFANTN